jgi:hypothetical protein
MEEEFKPELDALVNYVLSIPDSHVTAVYGDSPTYQNVPWSSGKTG